MGIVWYFYLLFFSSYLFANDHTSSSLAKILDPSTLSPLSLDLVCNQKILVVFVGQADLPATYIPTDPNAPSESVATRLLESDLAAAKEYRQILRKKEDDLRNALQRYEIACATAQSRRHPSLVYLSITDGPGALDTEINVSVLVNSPNYNTEYRASQFAKRPHRFDLQRKRLYPVVGDNLKFELNLAQSLNDILSDAVTLSHLVDDSTASQPNPTPFDQVIYIIKGHGGKSTAVKTPRIKSLQQLSNTDFLFESIANYLKGEKALITESANAGKQWRPLQQQGIPQLNNQEIESYGVRSLHLFDIHGPEAVPNTSEYFSPIWDTEKACEILVQAGHYKNHDDCKAANTEQQNVQGAAERTQNSTGHIVSYLSTSGALSPKVQSLKSSLIQRQVAKNPFTTKQIAETWGSIVNGPDAMKIYGPAITNAALALPGSISEHIVTFPVGIKSPTLLLLDSCFGSPRLFQSRLERALVKDATDWNRYVKHVQLPRNSLVQLFNSQPLMSERIDYGALNLVQLSLMSYVLRGRSLDVAEDYLGISRPEFENIGADLVDELIGKESLDIKDDKRTKERMYPGVENCYLTKTASGQPIVCRTKTLGGVVGIRRILVDDAEMLQASLEAYRKTPSELNWNTLAYTMQNIFIVVLSEDGSDISSSYRAALFSDFLFDSPSYDRPEFRKLAILLFGDLSEAYLDQVNTLDGFKIERAKRNMRFLFEAARVVEFGPNNSDFYGNLNQLVSWHVNTEEMIANFPSRDWAVGKVYADALSIVKRNYPRVTLQQVQQNSHVLFREFLQLQSEFCQQLVAYYTDTNTLRLNETLPDMTELKAKLQKFKNKFK